MTDNNHVGDNEYGYWQGQIETRVQSAEMRSDEIKASVKEVEIKVISRLDILTKLLTEHIQGQTLYNVQNDARLKLVESWKSACDEKSKGWGALLRSALVQLAFIAVGGLSGFLLSLYLHLYAK